MSWRLWRGGGRGEGDERGGRDEGMKGERKGVGIVGIVVVEEVHAGE
jgi:hypothetical protein